MNRDTTQLREAWLHDVAALTASRLFVPRGFPVPENVRLSVGFPYGRRGGKGAHAIGQCWAAEASAGKMHEIFISPELDSPVEVVATLIHEQAHAIVGLENKHNKVFRKCAVAVGPEGKMTATIAGEELTREIGFLLAKLPPYPHQRLTPQHSTGPKKQSTRMHKIVCGCGYTARTSAKWIEVGLPTCPCGELMSAED